MKKISLILLVIVFILAIYFIIALSPVLYAGNDVVTNEQKSKVVLTGHRGAAGLAPENNISSIKKALELNVDRVEIDVQQTKDNIVISMHDKSIDRTTNGKGLVKDLTYKEILKYSAGIKFSKDFESDKVPTLNEVFEVVNGKAILIIEIKDGNDYYPRIEQRVVDAINKYNAKKWTIIHSFNDKALKKVNEIDSTIILHKLFIADFPFFPIMYDGSFQITNLEQYNYCDEFSTFYPFTTKRLIEKVHKLGKKINVWTVNDSTKINKLINYGVDGIITNFPDYFNREKIKTKDMDTITVTGMAYDAKGGAIVQTENNEIYYIENLDSWPDEFLEKKIKVSGSIKSEYFDEKDLKNEKGEYIQGMVGEKRSLKNAKWKLAE